MSRHSLVIGYQAQTLIWTCILLANDVLGVTVDEEKTVRQGETVTLHTGFTGVQSVQILWTYGPVDPETIIFNSHDTTGVIKTEYSDRFRDRLQLDRQTGSLTIKNINITDSGVYKVQVFTGKVLYKTFCYTVYAAVSAPHIGNKQSRSAVSEASGPKCSVVCSVENGRDVTLSWYKGKEILNQTSSPDLNTILSLPLKIEDQDNNNNYSCVADNPVSHQTTQLNIEDYCPMFQRSSADSKNIINWLIPVIILICVLVILVFMVWYIKKHKQQVHQTEELTYGEVHVSTQNIPKTVSQVAEETVYSVIKT